MAEPNTPINGLDVEAFTQLYEGKPRIELRNGKVFELSPLGMDHSEIQLSVLDILRKVYPRPAYKTHMSGSLIIDEYNMPEPDVYVIRSTPKEEGVHYFHGKEAVIVVEVANSTQRTDLQNGGEGKLSLYASVGIQDVWVIDVKTRILHEFKNPNADTLIYEDTAKYSTGSNIIVKNEFVPVASFFQNI